MDGGEGGLQDLLQRDRKTNIDLDRAAAAFGGDDDEKQTAAAAPAPAPATTTTATTPATTLRSRSDRQRSTAAAADSARARKGFKASRQRRGSKDADGAEPASDQAAGPRRCRDAIEAGIAALSAGDPDAAIELFTLALELPGNGAFRLPGKAREFSCPSDAEESACLYNMACCYARKGPGFFDAAQECLEAACDDAGFDDWDTMLSDPDLQPLGADRLRRVADARRGPVAGLTGLLARVTGGGGGEDKMAVKVTDTRGKPWIMW